MRRADRLFQLIEILRRARQPVTAAAIAEELETSKRSVYRDISDLMAQRVPIRGEAGIGYVLESGFDMPPLMLTADEIEAAVLGAQWVSRRGDDSLASAAQSLVAKIGAIVPQHLQPLILDPITALPPRSVGLPTEVDLCGLRRHIRSGHKVKLRYRDEQDRATERVIWPVAIAYFEMSRLVAGWCELRSDFRHFRTDRITELTLLEEKYPERPSTLRVLWRKSLTPQSRVAGS
jgi:predicted DNA-binding transcriptional regulator YafY